MTPLTDLTSADYLGFPGGLYPGGNSRPPSYEEAGIALAKTVQPLDGTGKPSASGKIPLVAIGMSNTSSEFSQFIGLADADPGKNSSLLMIDAALSRANAREIAKPAGDYWRYVGRQLQSKNVSEAQVQVIWLKTALASEPGGFPEKPRILQHELRSIVEVLRSRFPQLKLVYVSSRIYGGYSQIDLSPEPIAYESGFAVKWLLEDYIRTWGDGDSMPWLSWGPYLWADGLMPRSDGLIWERDDFEPDGVHPSRQGALKVGRMLLDFFQTDSTAKPWFLSADR